MKRVVLALSLIFSKAISLIAIFIFASVLDIEEINEFSELQAISQLLIPIISLQLPAALFRFSKDSEHSDIVSFLFKNSLWIYVLSLAFLVVPYFYSLNFIILSVVLSSVCLQINLEVVRGRYNENFYYVANLLFVILYVISSIVAIVIFENFIAIFLCDIACSLIISLLINFKYKSESFCNVKFKLDSFYQLLKYSCPLIANALLWWFSTSGAILVASYFIEGNAAAIVNINLKASFLISTFAFIISNVYQRKLVDFYEIDQSNYRLELFKYISTSLMVIILVSVVNYFLFSWWLAKYYNEYFESEAFVLVNIFSGVIYGICAILGVNYICRKETAKSLISVSCGFFVTITLCLCIQDSYGVIGIAFSFMIGFLVNLLIRIFDLIRYK